MEVYICIKNKINFIKKEINSKNMRIIIIFLLNKNNKIIKSYDIFCVKLLINK